MIDLRHLYQRYDSNHRKTWTMADRCNYLTELMPTSLHRVRYRVSSVTLTSIVLRF